jgi:outer membrane protein, heavy metal efflux system
LLVHSILLLCLAGLSFADAVDRVDAAPDVVGANAAAQARSAAVSTLPSLTTNPTLTVQPGFRTDPTVPFPEVVATLQQSFNLAGLATQRREVGRAEVHSSRATALERRWQKRVETGRSWLEAWGAHQAVMLANEEHESAQALVQRLERALTTQAAVTRAEVEGARAFAAEAEAFSLMQEGRAFEAEAMLAEATGAERIEEVDGEPPALEAGPVVVATSVQERLLAAQLDAARAREGEARAQWGTSLTATLLGGREVPSQWVGAVGLGLTLPVFERGQAEAGAQHALSVRLEGELEAARRRTRLAARVIEHELVHTSEVFAAVDGRQRVAAMEAARLETLRFERGEATITELVVLRRQALTARVAALSARADLILARFKAREWRTMMEAAP